MSGNVEVSLYLVRHGECNANVAQIALEPTKDHLTEVGRAQAELLGKSLKNVNFTQVFASDYPRGEETARLVVGQSEVSKVNVQSEPRLRERDYAGFYGTPAKDIIVTLTGMMRKGIKYLDAEIDNSETVKEFESRIIDFFSELIKNLAKSEKAEENILLASHGLTLQRTMVLLNQRHQDFGITNWTKNLYSERLMRNTTFHKVVLTIPKDGSPITGHVPYAHCREHVLSEENNATREDVKDDKNYSFIEDSNELSSYEDETIHYCKPV